MTYEHPSFSLNLTKLTVLIRTSRGNQGTGTLYTSRSSPGLVYVITARHCLLEANGDLAFIEGVSIYQQQGEKTYNLTAGDRILVHPSVDFALLVLRADPILSIFGELSPLMIAHDNAGETSTFFYGYPKALSLNHPTRVNTTLLPPISGGLINLESNLSSENDLTENTVVGFSGSGICLICAGNVYLIGIVIKIAEWNRFTGLSIQYFNEVLKMFNLPPEPVHALETNPELLQSHRILSGNSKSLLDGISETVAGLHIDRTAYLQEAMLKLSQSNVLLVSGVAGAGKSTFSKVLIQKLQESENAKVISFFGSQVCQASTAELLALLNIPSTLNELMQSRDLNGLKIIYIDSAEKGFEHRQIEVIKELLKLTTIHKELKLILSIRSYALTLSTFGLFSSTAVAWEELTLDLFDDSEIKPVLDSFPGLAPLLKNRKIETFVRTPFYLDLLLGLIDDTKASELDELSLKNMLWQKIIRKDSHTRERLFESIAMERSRLMLAYVPLQDHTSETELQALLSDHVIKEHVDEFGIRSYAPAHDILEDWALVRYMRQSYATKPDLNTFITEIGNTYAMRRGFRFWLQELYRVDAADAQAITLKTIIGQTIAEFWKDEVTIALLNSSACPIFLDTNRALLLAENSRLLIRCIHLVRTACKTMTKGERIPEHHLDERKYMTSDVLLPIGPGWDALVSFIKNQFGKINDQHQLIARFLLDWGRAEQAELARASCDAAYIVLQLITQYGKDYSRHGSSLENTLCRKMIELLFKLTADNTHQIASFVRSSFDFVHGKAAQEFSFDEQDPEEELKLAFHQLVLEISLNYYTSEALSRYLPELVWEIAIYFWTDSAEVEASSKRKPYSEQYAPRISDMLDYAREPESEELFGLSSKGRRDFYPVSAFHTPFPHLLKYHPISAADQFSSLMNRSLNCYGKLKASDLTEITLKLNTGDSVRQFGNESLWNLYRGHHFGPDLLKCLHMGLENYLLDLGKSNTTADRALLALIVQKLFTQNISVSVTAVIASLAMAYPFAIREQLLPLFSFKETFQWDFQRLSSERNVFTPPDQSGKNPGAQKERIISKNLPHRKEKMEFLAFKMSFYQGFSEQIAGFIDEYEQELSLGIPQDYQHWPYVLLRLDRRKYKVTGKTEEGVIIEPELPAAMKLERDAAMKEFESESGITIWNWCHLILDKQQQENNTLENWRHFLKLSKKIAIDNSTDNMLYNSPMGIAEIGLSFYTNELTEAEKTWCVNTTITVVSYFLEEEFKQFNTGFGRYSHWNREIGFAFLPNLLQDSYGEEITTQVKEMLKVIVAIFKIDDGINKPLFEKIAKACWHYNLDFATICFNELLETAFDPDWRSKKDSLSEPVPMPDLNFNDSYDCLLNLDKAFLFLSEAATIDENDYAFLMAYQKFLVSLTHRKSQSNRPQRYRDYYHSHIHYQFKYGKLTIGHSGAAADLLFNELLSSLLSIKKEDMQLLTDDSYKFYNECLKDMIYYQDQNENTLRFQALWLIILISTFNYNRVYFLRFLLLKWYWKDSADSWPAIRENKKFYTGLLEQLGINDLDNSIALMAGIGFNDLFPESLTLFSQLVNTSDDRSWTSNYDTEKFIQRAFYNKGAEIKNNKIYQQDFFGILDQMISSGSSIAYLIKDSFVSV